MNVSLRPRIALLLVILLGTAWGLGTASSGPPTNPGTSDAAVMAATFYPQKDTWVDRLDPYRTWGSADYLRTGSSECEGYHFPTYAVMMMKFDLSSIPRGAVVLKAELHLYQLEAYGDPGDEPRYQLWVAERDWPENATWYDQAGICGGVRYLWLPAGTGWKVWDLTWHVQDWVDGTCPNFGFMVKTAIAPVEPDVCNGRVFASREHANRPWLEVSYTPPRDTPTPTATIRRPTPTRTGTATPTPTRTRPPALPRTVLLPIVLKHSPGNLTIALGQHNMQHGLALDDGEDVDTEVVWVGSPATEARRTGNGHALPSANGNNIADYYLQLRANDRFIHAGWPTTRVRVEVEYFDQGTDTFELQYDALSGGPLSDGRFKGAGLLHKSDSGQFRTAAFDLDDAYFANRDNGADLRISDNGDGAEVIRRVTITLLTP
jgi:hypothetical protein